MGVIDLRKYGDHYLKLRRIFERVVGIIAVSYTHLDVYKRQDQDCTV